MSIEIRQDEEGDFRILALAGRLDTETSADLELALQDLQAAGASKFLIDLAEIGYVSSAGLRVLLALAKQLEGGRGTLRLCALNDAVKQVFDVAGFSRMFAIFPNRAAALDARASSSSAPPAQSGLARRAAKLLGASEADTASATGAADIARAAAALLGAQKAGSTPSSNKRGAEKPAQSASPPKAAEKPPAQPDQRGVLGKVSSLFGKKK